MAMVVCINLALAKEKQALPKGWVLPNLASLAAAPDGYMRSKGNQLGTHIEADLNHDGKIIVADLLETRDGREYGLFIFTGDPKIDKSNPYIRGPRKRLESIDISLIDNSALEKYCTKERRDALGVCDTDYPRSGQSIALRFFESSVQVFFFADGQVRQMFISD